MRFWYNAVSGLRFLIASSTRSGLSLSSTRYFFLICRLERFGNRRWIREKSVPTAEAPERKTRCPHRSTSLPWCSWRMSQS